jgi:hypothetical protein
MHQDYSQHNLKTQQTPKLCSCLCFRSGVCLIRGTVPALLRFLIYFRQKIQLFPRGVLNGDFVPFLVNLMKTFNCEDYYAKTKWITMNQKDHRWHLSGKGKAFPLQALRVPGG